MSSNFSSYVKPVLDLNGLELVIFMQRIGLLVKSAFCNRQSCNHNEMTIRRKLMTIDQCKWVCSRCTHTQSVRNRSFFQGMRHSLPVILRCIWLWSLNKTDIIFKEGLMTQPTGRALFRKLYAVVKNSFKLQPLPKLGGPGSFVDVDESLFIKRKKSLLSRWHTEALHQSVGSMSLLQLEALHNRGRRVKARWVVGVLDKSYSPGRPVFKVVKNRSAHHLVAIIKKYVAPGSTVTTDKWRGYWPLKYFFTHRTVNHSRFYVDPITGINTNAIECEWRWAKEFLKRKCCGCKNKLQRHLNIYVWRRWRGEPYELGL